ncbi:FeoB-associated Cys-rich membrane protein [Flavobacterium akiainvivens]|nr:FeoB-associated Cys-rich membrane protein [Flavobacterium akiainvivens]SFQ72821.1 Virus attachment protein p12 family protein [Flavobacterium akiainvivens]
MDIQQIIAYAIVAVAAAWLVKKFFFKKKKKAGCGDDCGCH